MKKLRDLGLTYDQAAHGVQTAIAYAMEQGARATEPKHMRVGIDLEKAETFGLVTLLIEKGVFTGEEYLEAVRLGVNEEVAMREAEAKEKYGLTLVFR